MTKILDSCQSRLSRTPALQDMLSQLMDAINLYNTKEIDEFVVYNADLMKACDSIDLSYVSNIMKEIDFPSSLIHIFDVVYKSRTVKLQINQCKFEVDVSHVCTGDS